MDCLNKSVFLVVLQVLRLSFCIEVTLYDTTKLDSLDWVAFSQETTNNNRIGWREASYMTSEGNVVRVNTVCNVNFADVNNWIRLPYIIAVDQANRLYVNIRFTIRQCTGFPNPSALHRCKESFKLLYHDSSQAGKEDHLENNQSVYKHIDVIGANHLFTDPSDIRVNEETRSVTITKGGVYLAFHDQGACMTLLSLRVYYIACPQVAIGFADFPVTSTGPELASVVRVAGECVENAYGDLVPVAFCTADGSWLTVSGGCVCGKGFHSDSAAQTCTVFSATTHWTNFSEAVTTTRPTPQLDAVQTDVSSSAFLIIVSALVVGAVVCLSVLLVAAVLCIRWRRKKEEGTISESDCDFLEFIDTSLKQSSSHSHHHHQHHLYENQFVFLSKSKKSDRCLELNSSSIAIESILNSDFSSLICRGRFSQSGKDDNNIKVTIEILREKTSDRDRQNFWSKVNAWKQFDHPNVVVFHGVISSSVPNMIVMEYPANGTLEEYLKTNREHLQYKDLLRMIREVADSLTYLSGKGYMLTDISADTVLVGESLECKIASFGTIHKITDKFTVKPTEVRVRWSAPEVLSTGTLRSPSGVWSFGVFMWQTMSYGATPYERITDEEVVERVLKGERLPAPRTCPTSIYHLMEMCWTSDADRRPTISQLSIQLQQLQLSQNLIQLTDPASRLRITINPCNDVFHCLPIYDDYSPGNIPDLSLISAKDASPVA